MLIVAIIVLILITIEIVIILIDTNKLKELFRIHNIAIYGAKGKGKDLLTQMVINVRKKPYFSNINYGGMYHNININEITTEPNTYEEFINGKITTINKEDEREQADIYISDCGIFLPSQYDNLLSNKYKSLPIYYALSRHLYAENIHFNTQALNRVWIKLREQADYYILCKGVKKIFNIGFIIECRSYDNYEAAVNKKLPIKKRLMNGYSKAENDIYMYENGDIRDYKVFIFKKNIHYDTRAFHMKLFNKKAPTEREQKQIERINKQNGNN